MRLRTLFEALGKEVAIIFGRFNPPHKGHRAAWELASQSPIWFVGTNQSTVGPKDPLPYDVKVEAMKTIWPEIEGHIMPETSWLTMASKIYEKYPDSTLLCLTDEDWVTKTIVQYNGKEGAHGYYNFKKIEQKPTPRLSSATALRDAVIKGDRKAFADAAGVSENTTVAGKPFFDLVAEYLLPYQNAPKKAPAKKKVAQPVESVAEGQLELNTPDPVVVIQDKAGNVLDKMNLSIASQKYKLGSPQNIKSQLAHQDFTTIGNYVVVAPMTGQPQDKTTQGEGQVKEAPIEMDPQDPMNPMIYGHDKANPAQLKYRMNRASRQLADLAAQAQNASAGEWETITKLFKELSMNIEQIRHGLEELKKVRSRGGVRSRGIEKF